MGVDASEIKGTSSRRTAIYSGTRARRHEARNERTGQKFRSRGARAPVRVGVRRLRKNAAVVEREREEKRGGAGTGRARARKPAGEARALGEIEIRARAALRHSYISKDATGPLIGGGGGQKCRGGSCAPHAHVRAYTRAYYRCKRRPLAGLKLHVRNGISSRERKRESAR